MPGINGPGYDLSGIIGTNDFEAIGYDEPSYGRLAYDDPRYDDGTRYPGSESNFGGPRFDQTRLDNLFVQLGRTAAQVAPVARINAELFTNMADTFAAIGRNPVALLGDPNFSNKFLGLD